MMLLIVLIVLKVIFNLYGLILSFSIILSWIPSLYEFKIFRIVRQISDIYLEPFHGRLVLGAIDFTPMIALSFYFFVLGLNVW